MTKLILIFVGSGIGGVLRYLLSMAMQGAEPERFPIGTLAVNVIGCLAIGLLTAAPVPLREEHRAAIIVGVLGGFTTFSAFGRETFALAADKHLALAGLNIILSVMLGLAAVWIGTRIGQRMYAG